MLLNTLHKNDGNALRQLQTKIQVLQELKKTDYCLHQIALFVVKKTRFIKNKRHH